LALKRGAEEIKLRSALHVRNEGKTRFRRDVPAGKVQEQAFPQRVDNGPG
jgi:hypothetical protein